MTLLRLIVDRIAPTVCAYCEGGSGLAVDGNGQLLRRCESCGGSGRAAEHESNDRFTRILRYRGDAERKRAPRSAA